MVVGHYQPLADDGTFTLINLHGVHRPTKPVFCSRFRRQRQASLFAAGWLDFKPPATRLSSASGSDLAPRSLGRARGSRRRGTL